MLSIYFDYIFLHLRQKVRLRLESRSKFLSTFGPTPARTWPELGLKNPARRTTMSLIVHKNQTQQILISDSEIFRNVVKYRS